MDTAKLFAAGLQGTIPALAYIIPDMHGYASLINTPLQRGGHEPGTA
jgi:hypothetical protein